MDFNKMAQLIELINTSHDDKTFKDSILSILSELIKCQKETEDSLKRINNFLSVTPINKSTDSMITLTLSKISTLKDIIRTRIGNNDMFSMVMMEVESIENEINEHKSVTKWHLEKLNKIYLAERGFNI